jgi:hypothetical protein
MKLPNDYISWIKANPKLVDVKPTSNPDLFVLKYKRKVFYDGLWNRFLEDCRGTIVDMDWNIVSLPFRKVYNYGIEKEAPKLAPDTEIEVFKKYNGFMVALSSYKGKLLVSTTGSIDSSFAELAWKHVNRPNFDKEGYLAACQDLDATWLFECCDPSDPHIIAEQEGLHPIGYRYNDINLDMSHMTNFKGGEKMTIAELQELVKTVEHEGFVFYTKDGLSGKIKSPHYLVKKLFMRGRDMETLIARNAKHKIDEEYYPLLEYLSANRETFDAMDEQQRRIFIEEHLSKEDYGTA